MPYAHFLVPLEGGEEQERMNRFLLEYPVLKIEQRPVDLSSGPAWAYAVRYEKGGSLKTPAMKAESTQSNGAMANAIDYRDKLSPADFSRYVALKEWRKVRAEKEGTKVFAVFTNAQLAAIAEQKPTSPAALKTIDGVGDGRVDKYGPEVFALLKEAGGAGENGGGNPAAEIAKNSGRGA